MVGVVAEVKLRGFVEGVGNVGAYFRPQAQSPRRVLTFAIRHGSATQPQLASAVRQEIARLDRELPLLMCKRWSLAPIIADDPTFGDVARHQLRARRVAALRDRHLWRYWCTP